MLYIDINTEIVSNEIAQEYAYYGIDLISDDIINSKVNDALKAGETNIHFNINTPGGYLSSAASIITNIENMRNEYDFTLQTNIYGNAYSAGFLLFVIGDVRKVSALSAGMIHPALSSFFYSGTVNSIEQEFNKFKNAINVANKTLYNFFERYLSQEVLDRLNITDNFFNGNKEVYLSGNVLVELGLAEFFTEKASYGLGAVTNCYSTSCNLNLLRKINPEYTKGINVINKDNKIMVEVKTKLDEQLDEQEQKPEIKDAKKVFVNYISDNIQNLSKQNILDLYSNQDYSLTHVKDKLIENLRAENESLKVENSSLKLTPEKKPSVMEDVLNAIDTANQVIHAEKSTMVNLDPNELDSLTLEELINLAETIGVSTFGRSPRDFFKKVNSPDLQLQQKQLLINLIKNSEK